MMTVFYLLAGLLVLQGLIALQDGTRFLRFARRRLTEPLPDYAPPATLICPCKGLEPELEANLRALLAQDYPDLEVLFVLADGSDPARGVCERVAAGSGGCIRVIVAGRAEGRGEKVNNLLAGVAAARRESEVFIFADSDGRPRPRWVRTLVAYLADPAVGASSTFRWYIPEGDFLSGLQSAWNAPGVTYQGEWNRNFCWGGGMALRRATFERAHVARYWAGCVSDDLMLTRALRDAGKRIVFVPQCLVATHHPTTWARLLEWTNRQIILVRVYEPQLWWPAVMMYVFYCGMFLYGLTLALWLLPQSLQQGLSLLGLLALIAALAVTKGYLRYRAALLLLPEQAAALRRTWWSPTLQAALVPWLMAWNFVRAGFVRRFSWRGITYRLVSPWETRVVARDS